jgi:UDP-N-acetylglucosamine:LPS N-acetylglucosamine transferase
MTRVLILTASVGEGHDLPARTLTVQLQAESPETEVVVEDGLAAMGRLLAAVADDGIRAVTDRRQWVFDLSYGMFARFPPVRTVSRELLARVAAPRLRALVETVEPDVVVSVYPVTTEVLGWMRRRQMLAVPACAAITDLSALRYWAAPGIDLHLLTHPESIAEVRGIAGDETEIRCVHGLTAADFAEARDPLEARRALGLPADGKVVLVSGGGWAVGDLAGAVKAALATEGVACVACLCGRNDDVRRSLERDFAGRGRVRVVGFTDAMGDWLAAGDALVHSTAGLTILEAHIRGCAAISYGWGRGHIRLNNAAFRRFGLAEVAASRRDLADSLRVALRSRREPDLSFGQLPSAASLVLELAG